MNKILALAVSLIFTLSANLSFAQAERPLLEPALEVFNLYEMEPTVNPLGIELRTVGLSAIRIAQVKLKKGQSTPSHNHAFEQMVLIVEGRARATSGDQEFILEPGQMFAAPAFIHHTYTALEDTVAIEVFGPGATLPPNPNENNNP